MKLWIINNKWQLQNILKFQCTFRMQNTQLNRCLFTWNYFCLMVQFLQILKTAKMCDWDVKVKFGLSPKLMSFMFLCKYIVFHFFFDWLYWPFFVIIFLSTVNKYKIIIMVIIINIKSFLEINFCGISINGFRK